MAVRKFSCKFIVFLLILALVDYVLGGILKMAYFSTRSGQYSRTTYALERLDKQLIVFGSSRATHHYPARVMEKDLGLSFYNAGVDGQGILFHLAILRGVVKRYSPKVVILSLDENDFEKTTSSYDRLSELLPYYQTHPEIRDVIHMRSKLERVKLFSRVYPFNSMLLPMVVGIAKQKGWDDGSGYLPLHGVWKKPLVIKEWKDKGTDTQKMQAYETFLAEAKNAGVKLFVVVSPYFTKFSSRLAVLELARSKAAEQGIPFIDYSQEALFLEHPEYFSDTVHLNDNGAEVFSKMLVAVIKGHS